MSDSASAHAQLLGRWLNTIGGVDQNPGLDEVVITADGDALQVTARFEGAHGRGKWGPVRCELFECWEEDAVRGAAALGELVSDELHVELQLRINKGILCVMSWVRFRGEPAPGTDWVTRELFARAQEQPA